MAPCIFALLNLHYFNFKPFQCLSNTRCQFFPRSIVPSPSSLVSISCCHIPSISSQAHNTFCGGDFLLSFNRRAFSSLPSSLQEFHVHPRVYGSVLPNAAILNSIIVCNLQSGLHHHTRVKLKQMPWPNATRFILFLCM